MDTEEVMVQPRPGEETTARPLKGYEDFRPDLPDPANAISNFIEPPAPIRPEALYPIDALPPGVPGDPHGIEDGSITVKLGALDNPPRIRVQVSPTYPSDARGSGLTGQVLVEFLVDEHGQVQDPHVIKASDQRFEAPTLRAVGRWRFEPGTKQGRPVRFRMSVPVVFHLDA
jgi:periplasmic protein TonB